MVVQQGELLTWLGRPEEGVEWIRKAMRLNPHHPERFWSHLGKAYFAARQYGEAIEAFMHLSVMDHVQHAFVAACYGWLGDDVAGSAHLKKVRAIALDFGLESFLATLHYAQNPTRSTSATGLSKRVRTTACQRTTSGCNKASCSRLALRRMHRIGRLEVRLDWVRNMPVRCVLRQRKQPK